MKVRLRWSVHRRDSGCSEQRMLKIELRKRGRPRRGFMDIVKEDLLMVV